MSRKQYRPQGSSHEKKMTRKERKKQRAEWDANRPQEETVVAPTEEDEVQLKNITWYAVIGILALLGIMYYFFAFAS